MNDKRRSILQKKNKAYNEGFDASRNLEKNVLDFGDVCLRLEHTSDRATLLLQLDASSQTRE